MAFCSLQKEVELVFRVAGTRLPLSLLHSAKSMTIKLLLPPYSLKKLLYRVVDYPYYSRFCVLLLIVKRNRTGLGTQFSTELPAFGQKYVCQIIVTPLTLGKNYYTK